MLVFGFIALYWAGGLLANQLVVGADSVVLIWAPSALSFILLLHKGRRWWPLIVVADVVFSLTRTDVPSVFLPFTAAANTIGALAATTVARAVGFVPGRGFDFAAVRGIAAGGLALALTSLPFGLVGLLAAGFTTVEAAPGSAAKWMMANVFGTLVMAPALSLLWSGRRSGAMQWDTEPWTLESLGWSVVLALSLLAVARTDSASVLNGQAVLALPSLVLLWGAIRLPPRLLAAGVLTCGVALPLVAASDNGSLLEPQTTLEALLLLALLISVTLAPLVLMAAIGESRRTGAEAL